MNTDEKIFQREYPAGYITKSQFIKIYKDLYKRGRPEQFAKYAFAAYDRNNDGVVSFDEFIIYTMPLLMKRTNIVALDKNGFEKLELAFEIFDVIC